jgi:uncharacterized membrane protein YphA (DoxX/SURF4 family)
MGIVVAAEKALRDNRKWLPFIGRVFLVSTFLEDAYRIMTNWDVQASFLTSEHNTFVFNDAVAKSFLGLCFFAEAVGGVLILLNKFVKYAASLLLGYMLFLIVVYGFGLPDWVHHQGRLRFFIRSAALAGGLMMIIADASFRSKENERNRGFAGVPMLDVNKAANYLQLVGRFLMAGLCLQFWTHESHSWGQMIVYGGIASIASVMVVLGYKAKYSSLLLATFLTGTHILINNFWEKTPAHMDALQYFFFQDLSILGGLILLVALGPGGMSVDEKKAM